jgi:hypothetical protein
VRTARLERIRPSDQNWKERREPVEDDALAPRKTAWPSMPAISFLTASNGETLRSQSDPSRCDGNSVSGKVRESKV